MIWYHGTTEDNWKKIQAEGVLFGVRRVVSSKYPHFFNPSRCTYLATDKIEAGMYGDVVLEVEYDPNINPDMNNYSEGAWQVRVYEPIPISNVKQTENNNMKFTVKLMSFNQDGESTNANGRIYRKEDLEKFVKNYKECGEVMVGRPFDEAYSYDPVSMSVISHKITDMWFDGEDLNMNGEIFDTPKGKMIQQCIDEKVPLTVVPVGNVTVDENGEKHIDTLISFDIVRVPAQSEDTIKTTEEQHDGSSKK